MKLTRNVAGILQHLATVGQYKETDLLKLWDDVQTLKAMLKEAAEDQYSNNHRDLFQEASALCRSCGIEESLTAIEKRSGSSDLFEYTKKIHDNYYK